MNKRELNKVFKLIENEELDLAKANILRIMEDETEKSKKAALDKLEQEKDTIKADETYSLNEKEIDVNDTADQMALDDVTDNTIDIEDSGTFDPSIASNVAKEEVDPNEVNYRFTDVEKDIEELKAKFAELMSGNNSSVEEDTLETDLTADPKTGDLAEETDCDNEEEPEEDTANESVSESFDYTLENLISEDLVSSIFEEYKLQPVKEPKNVDGEEAGDGVRVSQNDISPLTNQDKTELETTAEPIKIDTNSHSGYEREKAPPVKVVDLGDVVNRPDIKVVPKDGDPSALINSKQGFGGDDSKSPISGD